MIILTENNYKRLDTIPYVENPKENPDIVYYPDIFNVNAVEKNNGSVVSYTL